MRICGYPSSVIAVDHSLGEAGADCLSIRDARNLFFQHVLHQPYGDSRPIEIKASASAWHDRARPALVVQIAPQPRLLTLSGQPVDIALEAWRFAVDRPSLAGHNFCDATAYWRIAFHVS